MKITYNWLAEYVDFDWDWRELVERLTMSGLEREAVTDLGERLHGVVVGGVLERTQHPNADRLSVCRVDLGSPAPATIVCGAPNVAVGQKVAVVTPGQTLPDGTRIRQAKIRGVESQGMICSEVELILGEDASGIMVLPDDYRIGADFAVESGLDDVLIEFEVTPNRPDCLSLMGIAREVSALNGSPLRHPFTPESLAESGPPAFELAAIDIEDAEGCPRYVGRVISEVRVGTSPQWLQDRLRSVDLRPINNVVDVTNFVMMELGQPLHAFDLARLEDSRIVVRRARPGEHLKILDGSDLDLDEEVLVIADGRRPVALAGIMGGADSEVTDQTTDILLESAHFAPPLIRRGVSRLGVATDASARFERGTDWALPPLAADRAAQLIAETAGGRIAPGRLDACPGQLTSPVIRLRPERVNALLNTDLDGEACGRILELLGCQVGRLDTALRVTVPSYRPDLTREADLVEEVGRIHGYHHIEESRSIRSPMPTARRGDFHVQGAIRRRLAGFGLDEVVTNTIVERNWIEASGQPVSEVLELANPPTESQCLLRPTLIPSLMDVARRNFNQRAEAVAIFELGKRFRTHADGEAGGEELCLAGLWSGLGGLSPWKRDRRPVDFLDMKGLLETFLVDIRPGFSSAEHALFRRGHCARIEVEGGVLLGHVGEVTEHLAASFDLGGGVYIFEVGYRALADSLNATERGFKPLPKFPPIERDIAVVVEEAVPAELLVTEIRSVEPDLTESVDLFDVYTGDQVAENCKSLAFSLRLRSGERTLEDREADVVMERVLSRLRQRFDARLRG